MKRKKLKKRIKRDSINIEIEEKNYDGISVYSIIKRFPRIGDLDFWELNLPFDYPFKKALEIYINRIFFSVRLIIAVLFVLFLTVFI